MSYIYEKLSSIYGDNLMEMSKIIIGAMRYKDRISTITTVRAAIDAGFNYIDTSPCYCYQSEDENSESWVGDAVNYTDYRERVMVSAKCSPGNGGLSLGDFDQASGFGVRTENQLHLMFNQSLKRQNSGYFDFYHLWTTHTPEQLQEALKPGGWYDGLMSLKEKWNTLGITTHADTATILGFLKTGKFKTVTVPLNVINRTRLGILPFCAENGITVIAMNPLAGGFLGTQDRLKELSLRYLMALPNVHLLIGFSSVQEVEYASWIQKTTPEGGGDPDQILMEVDSMLDTDEPRCTSCGYCSPCPQGINIGACLSYFNILKYMGIREAKSAFMGKQWEDGLRLDKCISCGVCESRCPNALPLGMIISEAQKLLYSVV
jgi:predicted aldo/keto reductase-like oxidoreductase